jgi:hypothetical protein
MQVKESSFMYVHFGHYFFYYSWGGKELSPLVLRQQIGLCQIFQLFIHKVAMLSLYITVKRMKISTSPTDL